MKHYISFIHWVAICDVQMRIYTASRRIHSAVTSVYPAIFNFLRRAKPRTKNPSYSAPYTSPVQNIQTTLAQFISSSHEPIIMPSHRRTSVVIVIIHFYCKLCLANQNLIKELFLFKLISKCISIIRRLLVLCGFNRTIFHIYWVQLWMLSRESMVYCRQSVIMDGSCITLIYGDMCAMVWVARKAVFIHILRVYCFLFIRTFRVPYERWAYKRIYRYVHAKNFIVI